MSLWVMLSSRLAGRPNSVNSPVATPLNTHTTGLKTRMHHCIGPTTRSASRSGSVMPMRLGNRSANRMNNPVTTRKDRMKPTVCAVSGARPSGSTSAKYGVSDPSPTMPPRMAMAFSAICTTVK